MSKLMINHCLKLFKSKEQKYIVEHVKNIIFTKESSHYNRFTQNLYINEDADEWEIVHEMSHILEDMYDIYNNRGFLSFIQNIVHPSSKIIYDEYTFNKAIFRIEDDSLISEYQGRLYEEVSFFEDDNLEQLNPIALGDFFAEAYTCFLIDGLRLKRTNRNLYNYILSI